MENKVERIKELVSMINEHSHNYYMLDKPTITDKQYDALYDELIELEKTTGFILSISPTQKVQGQILDGLTKVKHTEPMLSADKTKDIGGIVKFVSIYNCVLSWKLDGLTIVLRYNNGKLMQAVTRGGGDEGEDVTHNIKMFTNIPLTIEYKGYLEVRGEGLVTYSEFERINTELITNNEEPYVHVRNLAAGSVRQLDSNITKNRKLIFKAFGIVKCDNSISYKDLQFKFLIDLGFDVVEYVIVKKQNVVEEIGNFKSRINSLNYATDGLIIEYNDTIFGRSLGSNGHHTNNMIALKWQDDTVETIFDYVEWTTNRTSVITPTAVFKTCIIDGTEVSRASLHNVDIFQGLELGNGDLITVYKANMIIPQLDDNLTRINSEKIPNICPSCGSPTEIRKLKTARFLYCTNDNCIAKNIQGLIHAVSKQALNIEGLSEASIELFVNKGFIKEIADIFKLEQYKSTIVSLEGWGLKSYNKLINAINKAKDTNMQRVLISLGIPQIGVGGAKQIAKHFNSDIDEFIKAVTQEYDFTKIEDVGEITSEAIQTWFKNQNNQDIFIHLLDLINIKREVKSETKGKDLNGMIFVITGSVIHFKNRDEIKTLIESLGGKCSGSVSSKTSYLINNDIESTSGKNKDAKKLGVPIISEQDFLDMIK